MSSALDSHKPRDHHKRLFAAIPIERHFLSVFSKYRDTHGRIPYLTWTPEKKLHITLLFIGSVPDERVTDVSFALEASAKNRQPFPLMLKKVTYAPPDRPADMVWAYFEPSHDLDAFAHDLHERLTSLGLTPADSFKNARDVILPHITLARFKRQDVQKLTELRRTELEGFQLLVEDVLLVESRSTPQGSQYTTVAEYPLTSL